MLKEEDQYKLPDMRRQAEKLNRLTGFESQEIDCCVFSHIAYTGPFSTHTHCPWPGCNHPRLRPNETPFKTYVYLPLIYRLDYHWGMKHCADTLHHKAEAYFCTYDAEATDQHDPSHIESWFSGQHYRDLRHQGLFSESTDMALQLSLDAVGLIERGQHLCTPVIILINNLPLSLRYLSRNVLLSMVIPGPKKYKDLDSFLYPLIQECEMLDTGITLWDAHTGQTFNLCAWLVGITGDGPAMADAIGMKTPGNAVAPCRFCHVFGTKSTTNTYYVINKDIIDNIDRQDRLQWEIDKVMEGGGDWTKIFGITCKSCFLTLRSLDFPWSFTIDIMHCILLNTVKNLWHIWGGTYIPADQWDPANYVLTKREVELIQSQLSQSLADIPFSMGTIPPLEQAGWFKSAAWKCFLEVYAPSLMWNYIPNEAVDNLALLQKIWRIVTRRTITQNEMLWLESYVQQFVRQYKRIYYHNDPNRVAACSVNIHWLLHLPECTQRNGPAIGFWAYTMERSCFCIQKMAKSKTQLGQSIANHCTREEQLNLRAVSKKFDKAPYYNHSIRIEDHLQHKITAPTKERRQTRLQTHRFLPLSDVRRCQLGGLFVGGAPEPNDIYYFKKCKLLDRVTLVGSAALQKDDSVNRASYHVCFKNEDDGKDDALRFGSIVIFVSTFAYLGAWACIQEWEGVDYCNYGIVTVKAWGLRENYPLHYIPISCILYKVGTLKGRVGYRDMVVGVRHYLDQDTEGWAHQEHQDKDDD